MPSLLSILNTFPNQDLSTSAKPRRIPAQPTWRITVLAAVYITAVLNQSLFGNLIAAHQATLQSQLAFVSCSALIVFAVVLTVVSFGAFRATLKPWLTFLLISGALASHFMDQYQIVLNRDMIRNILETDWNEASELLNLPLIAHAVVYGVLPALLVLATPLKQDLWWRGLLKKAGTLAVCLSVIVIAAYSQYQDYASVFRNHRELRYQLVPTGYLYAGFSFAGAHFNHGPRPHLTLGADAHKNSLWPLQSGRKHLVVMVVGETARAADFALGGYERNTNPRLQQEDVIYFNNVHSCGTATAISVPCLFSYYGREDYDEEQIQDSDNLLDIVQRAGADVLWLDNNSGCKGVCERVPHEDLSHSKDPILCNQHECRDMILLRNLEHRIDQLEHDGIIVLHQKGSHGPGYFLRTPTDTKPFQPECHSTELQQCSQEEIRNAYDNTIAYTDQVLAELIELLKRKSDEYSSALIYVSDHGESLGEGNVYLHGLPYSIAPEEQTHVPMLLWLSAHFATDMGISESCLRNEREQTFSHDNIFDSVLDLMGIETNLLRGDHSLIAPCKTPT